MSRSSSVRSTNSCCLSTPLTLDAPDPIPCLLCDVLRGTPAGPRWPPRSNRYWIAVCRAVVSSELHVAPRHPLLSPITRSDPARTDEKALQAGEPREPVQADA